MRIALTGCAHPFGEGSFYGAERIIWYLAKELKTRGHMVVFFAIKGCNLPGFIHALVEKPWDGEIDIYYKAIQEYEQKTVSQFDVVHSFQFGPIDPNAVECYRYCHENFAISPANMYNKIAYSKKINSVSGNNGTVIYFGLPEELYTFEEHPMDYLVWIGRMDMGKGPHSAIEVAKRAGKRLILMGPAYHYPYSYDNIFPHVDGKSVIWLRATDDEIKNRVIRKACALINPIWKDYNEMFGIVNIEALACGTPVIGWGNRQSTSAINFEGGEIIKDGEHGFIIEHDGWTEEERQKAIDRSVEAVKNISSIDRKKCRDLFLSRFTSKIMTEKTLKYYDIIRQRKKVYDVTGEL